ncbi:SgcJ/EcaC family oxidoreductase [Brevibacillus choshinensis]|uniref:SgcJ/EcaC family oxidoreductase n=1 Tax=Brevibacillus choshinensis TaxID=54911 RepID=A0ABX7FSU8_BRECH|nr:SgcJ/EcaC family oxidoreductase [Brevibacillus choshinensis]QRG68664.1 SgcJ/EcaC family oxidoreductase [Brevibacillus choshinensis]
MKNRKSDIEAIRRLFADMCEAWNNGDGPAFGQCFTEDADYVTFMGHHLRGRSQIAGVHQQLFNGPLKGSRLESSATEQPHPRFLSPDIAIILATGEAALANGAADPNDRGSINTNVVMKVDGQWKITAFHNCRVQSMPGGQFQK